MTARYLAALATGMATLAGAGVAQAGGCASCAPPPKSCDCTVPTTHQVTVPGVGVSPPSVYVNAPSIYVALPNVEVQSGAVAVASASSTASASSSSDANASGSALSNSAALANAQANALGAVYNGGGGSSFSASEGATGYIPNLDVEGEAAETRRICAEFRSVAALTAIQAQCLDDKDIPHPASQVAPEREVLPTYEGELYRCIAGARMQYTLAEFHGQASFDHGQSFTCAKGEALYHSAAGQLACRPQKPARDCNERSLLRRFGAGIKVLSLARAQQCVAYRSVTAKASGGGGSLILDGGVGGIVR